MFRDWLRSFFGSSSAADDDLSLRVLAAIAKADESIKISELEGIDLYIECHRKRSSLSEPELQARFRLLINEPLDQAQLLHEILTDTKKQKVIARLVTDMRKIAVVDNEISGREEALFRLISAASGLEPGSIRRIYGMPLSQYELEYLDRCRELSPRDEDTNSSQAA